MISLVCKYEAKLQVYLEFCKWPENRVDFVYLQRQIKVYISILLQSRTMLYDQNWTILIRKSGLSLIITPNNNLANILKYIFNALKKGCLIEFLFHSLGIEYYTTCYIMYCIFTNLFSI